MANHIIVLITIMLATGVFGGLVNYYMQLQHEPETTSMARSLVVGVGASFLVPVMLNIVNSDLIQQSQGDPSGLLIFTGYCLLAAIASKFFTNRLTDKIINEAQSARERSEYLQHELRNMHAELLPLVEVETEINLGIDDNQGPISEDEELDVTSSKVLQNLGSGRYIFRSLAGLCMESESDETTMLKTLNILVTRGLAGRTRGKKGMRWHITEKGRRVLAAEK